MTQIEKEIILITKTLEDEFGFKIPGSFIPGQDSKDIYAFIDIEKLFLNDFKFMSEIINGLGIHEKYKINKEDFINLNVPPLFPSRNTEEKDIGMGYAKNSFNGKGPDAPEAEEIKDLLIDAGEDEHLHLYSKAKAARLLTNIADDKITDFFVKIKREELKEVTKILIDYVIDLLTLSHTTDEIINEMQRIYFELNGGHAFPYAAPLEIIESKWLTLGVEFTNIIFEKYIETMDIKLPDEYYEINSYQKKNDYILEKYKNIVMSEDARNHFFVMITSEIELIEKSIEEIEVIDDLKKLETSWSLAYALRDQKLLKKLNLSHKKILIEADEHYVPATYFINSKNELLIISSRVTNYGKLNEKVKQIIGKLEKRNQTFNSYKLLLNQKNFNSTEDFGKVTIYKKTDYWN